jgi:hypothetical protein
MVARLTICFKRSAVDWDFWDESHVPYIRVQMYDILRWEVHVLLPSNKEIKRFQYLLLPIKIWSLYLCHLIQEVQAHLYALQFGNILLFIIKYYEIKLTSVTGLY